MLKYIAYGLISLVVLLLIGGFSLTASPYYFYHKIVNQGYNFDWYSLDMRFEKIAKPDYDRDLKSEIIDNERLWSKFHFKNHMIPIPVKNPYFFVSPVLNYNSKTDSTNLGLSISNAEKKTISEIYFLPRFEIPAPSKGQKLFEFPVVANMMKNYDTTKVWKDIFSKDVSNWKISNEEMVYNLYLMEVRSKIFNNKLINYYYLNNMDKAVVEISYKDKDYLSEFIFSRRGNTIYPLLMITERNNSEAMKIRYKMISDVEFINTTPTLSDIIYREFKNLTYNKQVDHEGMLYLLSAWSHGPSRVEFLRETIQYLERGNQNQKQLEPLYRYMFKRFGKTFAKREVGGLNLEFEILLKLRLEVEEEDNRQRRAKETPAFIPKQRNLKEEYDQLIDKTKGKIKSSSKTIRMN